MINLDEIDDTTTSFSLAVVVRVHSHAHLRFQDCCICLIFEMLVSLLQRLQESSSSSIKV
jgi:hypothetical protein